MLQTPGATSYMGCIGKDKFGEEMKKNAQAAGVTVSSKSLSLSLSFSWHLMQ
jgi:sugar/nucleoside kinase (ribokinase family)